jgi:hypothetical protein
MKINNQKAKLIDHEIELFVHAEKITFRSGYEIDISTYDASDSQYRNAILLTTVKVVIQIPDISEIDFTSLEIEGLEEIKSKLRAECQQKIDNIDGQIQQLLSIEHKDLS